MNNLTLEYALKYIELGWPVFPIHGIKNGVCTCNKRKTCGKKSGKHPILSNGFLGATTDKKKATIWFTSFKDANIGIATGKESGIVVVDIDGDLPIAFNDIPDTVEQITGSGGRHLIFKRPDESTKFVTKTNVFPEIDSRADGGYIVVPPSKHLSGKEYEWEASGNPFDVELAETPKWWYSQIKEKERVGIAPSICDSIPENLNEILENIPADDYDVWYKVGLAIYRMDNGLDGLEYFDYWSQKSNKYNEKTTYNKFKSFKNNKNDNPVSIGYLKQLAEKHGWIDSKVIEGRGISNRFLKNHRQKEAEKILSAKKKNKKTPEVKRPNLMPHKDNLIAKMATQILKHSIYPQPELAVGAVIGFLGAICGRKFKTETDLRTNFYIFGIAESGVGKDKAFSILDKWASDFEVDKYLGGSDMTSGQAILTALKNQPSKLFPIDELGHFLLSAKGGKGDVKDILPTFMKLYSHSNKTYRGREYANDKERPREDILEPNCCIYGATTHDVFYKSLSSGEGSDGMLSRVLIIDTDIKRPKGLRKVPLYNTNYDIKYQLQKLDKYTGTGGNLSGKGDSSINTIKAMVVPMSSDVDDLFYDLSETSYDLSTDSISRSIYSRVTENAIKLALLHAIGKNIDNPIIELDSFEWARDFAFYSANHLLKELADRVSDNETESNHKKVLRMIKSNKNGISRTALTKKTYFLRSRDLSEILSKLTEAGEIRTEQRKETRTVNYYIAN